MAVAHIKTAEFDSFIAEGTTLVDFWATWCGPCRMQAPILEQLDGELGGSVRIGKVDVDEEPELARRFGVMSIPTLVYLKNGQEFDRKIGVQPETELAAALCPAISPSPTAFAICKGPPVQSPAANTPGSPAAMRRSVFT